MNSRNVWLLVCLGGCGGGAIEPDFVLSYNARTSKSGVILGEQADRFSVSSVWLRLGEVTLTGDCGDAPIETTTDALGLVDHVDPAAEVQHLDVEASTICALDTTLVVDPEATDDPEEVAGAAAALLGTLADGRAFQVLIREEIPLSLVLADEPVPATGNWLLSFDVAAWLDAKALAEPSGFPIIVSSNTNPGIYAGILARLIYGVQLHLDADNDGQVDVTERRLDIR